MIIEDVDDESDQELLEILKELLDDRREQEMMKEMKLDKDPEFKKKMKES